MEGQRGRRKREGQRRLDLDGDVTQTLQAAGMIKYSRGTIQILDVDSLQETACECYTTVNRHYAQLLGDPKNSSSPSIEMRPRK